MTPFYCKQNKFCSKRGLYISHVVVRLILFFLFCSSLFHECSFFSFGDNSFIIIIFFYSYFFCNAEFLLCFLLLDRTFLFQFFFSLSLSCKDTIYELRIRFYFFHGFVSSFLLRFFFRVSRTFSCRNVLYDHLCDENWILCIVE